MLQEKKHRFIQVMEVIMKWNESDEVFQCGRLSELGRMLQGNDFWP